MFEERDMKTLYIGHVRRTNSMLKEFGHCFRNITNTLGCKDVPPEVVKEIREVASRVVKFTQLEHWQLICSTPVSGAQRHAAETLAKLMHKSCCQAAGGVHTCRVRKISISAMAKDMRADTVRETFEFIFPSTTTSLMILSYHIRHSPMTVHTLKDVDTAKNLWTGEILRL
jgi:hypothetical protein